MFQKLISIQQKLLLYFDLYQNTAEPTALQ